MIKDFLNKLDKNARVAIFGAGVCGRQLKLEIEKNRPDIKIQFYVDSFVQGEVDGLDVKNIAQLGDLKKDFDILLFTPTKVLPQLQVIFEYFDVPYIAISSELERYIRYSSDGSLVEKQKQALNVFENDTDRDFYNLIWKSFYIGISPRKATDFVAEKYNITSTLFRNYNIHYLEFINKNAIKTVLDCGFCDGIHSIAHKRVMPNLKKTYAFEPMYEKFKSEIVDKILKKENFVEIVPYGVYDRQGEISFYENTAIQGASRISEAQKTRGKRATEIPTIIKITTIDAFCKENKIEKVDFIKMDIEGSELPALKYGMQTIKKDRPQMAISIYHSVSDYVEIPLYLASELENYSFKFGHYSPNKTESVLYAIPNELR